MAKLLVSEKTGQQKTQTDAQREKKIQKSFKRCGDKAKKKKKSGFLGGKRKIEKNKIFKELMAKNFANLIKDMTPQFQEVQKNQRRININKTSCRHIIV